MAKDRQRQRTPRLSDVIDAKIDNRLENLHTTMPGRVEKYEGGKADVKPLLKRPLVDEDGVDIEAESLPVIPNVPIKFPRADFNGSRFFMSWPLKRGDLVVLYFAERSLDRWLSTAAGEEVDPVQLRKHDLSDCFAEPGLYPFEEPLADAHPDNLTIGKDGGGMQLHFLPDDTVEFRKGGDADVSVAIAETLEQLYGALKSYIENAIVPTGVGPSGTILAGSGPAPEWDPEIASALLRLKDNG